MQRLQLEQDEHLTRKEYLKRKKKQFKDLQNKSKFSYILIIGIILLVIYVLIQYHVYSTSNNLKYTEDNAISKQKVYQLYYVTEGYTYEPVYSLNKIYTNSFNDKSVYQSSGMYSIKVNEQYIFGMKSNGIYKLNKETNIIETLVEKDVKKYTLQGDNIYYIDTNNNLFSIDVNTAEAKNLAISNVSEVIVDSNNIYCVIDEKTKRVITKYDLNGQNKVNLTGACNTSYMISDDSKLYFVNKADSNKLYSIGKDGSNLINIGDIYSLTDNGTIVDIDGSNYMFASNGYVYYINTQDGNNLWRINLDTKEKNKLVSMSVDYIYNVDDTVFFKVKNEMGIYLYNKETNFLSQVTKRKVKDFFVDSFATIDNNIKK